MSNSVDDTSYSNCLMATLNARLAVPGRCFRESFAGEEDLFYYKPSLDSPSGTFNIQFNVERASVSSVMDIKRRSRNSGPMYSDFSSKRNLIHDLQSQDILHDHAMMVRALEDGSIPALNFAQKSPSTHVSPPAVRRHTFMNSRGASAPKLERALRHLSGPNMSTARPQPASATEKGDSVGDHFPLKLEPLRAPEATL